MIIFDTILGYCIARFLAGKKTGQQGRIKSIRFQVKNDYVVHLHHWFFSLLVIGGLMLVDIQSFFVYGIFAGAAMQGLTYGDFYKLVYRNSNGGSRQAFMTQKMSESR